MHLPAPRRGAAALLLVGSLLAATAPTGASADGPRNDDNHGGTFPGGTPTACRPTGDVVITDPTAFGNNNGGVIRVDRGSGARTTLSENNNPLGAPSLETPMGIAYESSGDIVLVDAWQTIGPGTPGVVRVDPDTGARTIVSNNSSPAGGPSFVAPNGIAVEKDGSILVADYGAFAPGTGGIIRVDPVTGARTTLSRNGAPLGGPQFGLPWDVAVADNGKIYVIDDSSGGGKVIEVDPVTGARTLVSRNTSPAGGPSFDWPWGIAIEKDGAILVSDMTAFGGQPGIIRVDPNTGVRTTVSENTAPAGGPSFVATGDLAVEPCGGILINDLGPSGTGVDGSVIHVDPDTGERTIVSDDAAPVGAPEFAWPWGIAVKAGGLVTTAPTGPFKP